MEIVVERHMFRQYSTIGRMYIDGVEKCFTLEDRVRKDDEPKVYGETAIPAGLYTVDLRRDGKMYPDYMNRYKGIGQERGMLWLRHIPGYEFVYIHVGNYPRDTLGCILIGKGHDGGDAILRSVAAYMELYPLIASAIERGDKVTCEVR